MSDKDLTQLENVLPCEVWTYQREHVVTGHRDEVKRSRFAPDCIRHKTLQHAINYWNSRGSDWRYSVVASPDTNDPRQ